MKKFKDLEFKNHRVDGVYATIQFSNGFGASVIKTSFSYGGSSGLFELAVLDHNGNVTYDTPVTDNVLGHLDETMITKVLQKIQSL